MDSMDAAGKLSLFGFEPGEEGVRQFQISQGLLGDGNIGPRTERVLNTWENYFCGVSDRMGLSNTTGKWLKKEVSWGFADSSASLPGFSYSDLVSLYAESFASWNRVCGLKFRHAKGEPAADIVIEFGNIDKASGVLAWSELPNGQEDRDLKQRYDSSEKFVNSKNPIRGEIDLLRVANHENGHGIGLSHIPNSMGEALLNPMYNRQIRYPQTLDIAEAVKRYGPPEVAAVPTDVMMTLQVGGDLYRWSARKV